MRQVLFWIPDPTGWFPGGVPIFGFGAMLLVAFLVCTALASRRADREGVGRDRIQDLAIWVIITGVVGARIVYLIQYNRPLTEIFNIWQGGIVFYGSAFGGVAGYVAAWWLFMRKLGIPFWRPADVIAPSIAVGLLIGRVGCFLNGCCYGHLACPGAAAAYFPALNSPPRDWLVEKTGYQLLAGFTLADYAAAPIVSYVEPGSAADRAGLQAGDAILAVNGKPVAHTYPDLTGEDGALSSRGWQRGKSELALRVRRNGAEVDLPPFVPRTLGLHPTQLYESVSMFLLFLLLTAFYPYRRHDGQVFVLLMVCYAVHRFLNEMLRNDTDPVLFGLTLSQNGSLLILCIAAVLEGVLRRTQTPLSALPPSEPKFEGLTSKPK